MGLHDGKVWTFPSLLQRKNDMKFEDGKQWKNWRIFEMGKLMALSTIEWKLSSRFMDDRKQFLEMRIKHINYQPEIKQTAITTDSLG